MKIFRSPILWLFLGIIGALVVVGLIAWLFFVIFGFKITYAPNLENSWDAVSAIAAWVSIVVTALSLPVSVVAVFVAIHIPQKIADNQDRIQLFDKRLECYSVIHKLLVCADQIADENSNEAIQTAFKIWIGQPERFTTDESVAHIILDLKRMEQTIISGEFLFPHYNVKMLQDVINEAIDLANSVATPNKAEAKEQISDKAMEHKAKFCQLCDEFFKEYNDSIERELNLTNKAK